MKVEITYTLRCLAIQLITIRYIFYLRLRSNLNVKKSWLNILQSFFSKWTHCVKWFCVKFFVQHKINRNLFKSIFINNSITSFAYRFRVLFNQWKWKIKKNHYTHYSWKVNGLLISCVLIHIFFLWDCSIKKNKLGLSLFFYPSPREITWLQSGLISWQGNYLLSFISFAQI